MACQAPAWAAVGAVKAPVNQARVAGENVSRAEAGWSDMLPIVHPATDNRPDPQVSGVRPAVTTPQPYCPHCTMADMARQQSARHSGQDRGPDRGRESARYWRYPELPGVDLLRARYVRKTFVRHTHESFVVAAITEGVETFEHQGTVERAGVGGLALINPDTSHTGQAGVPEGWTYSVLYPSADTVARIAAETTTIRGTPGFTSPVVHDPYASRLVTEVHRAAEQGNALAADTLLRVAVARLLRLHGAPMPAREARTAGARNAVRARLILEQRMADPPSLEKLAAELGTSPFALLRAFRATYGMPPHAWLTDARVRRARGLLDAGTAPAEAAVAVGFTDQPHLNRHFGRIVGVPPGAYQRERARSAATASAAAKMYKTGTGSRP
jgi:AraC-like DNA-binding protein